jgi:hypothetical protein
MRKLGEVLLILNDKFAVIRATEPLILGSEVQTFKENKLDEAAQTKSGLKEIQIPKGKLKVVMMQENNVYLVSVITKRSAENSSENQSLARSLSLYNSIFGKAPAEVDNTGGEIAGYSAKLDVSQAIKFDYNVLVSPGDSVGIHAPVPVTTSATPAPTARPV